MPDHEQPFPEVEKTRCLKGMDRDLFIENGDDDPYNEEIEEDEQKPWLVLVAKLFGTIGITIENPELKRIYVDKYEECYMDDDVRPYALYHCIEVLRDE